MFETPVVHCISSYSNCFETVDWYPFETCLLQTSQVREEGCPQDPALSLVVGSPHGFRVEIQEPAVLGNGKRRLAKTQTEFGCRHTKSLCRIAAKMILRVDMAFESKSKGIWRCFRSRCRWTPFWHPIFCPMETMCKQFGCILSSFRILLRAVYKI